MPTPTDVLRVARSQLGYVEGARNSNKYGAEYGGDNQPWCSWYQRWVFDHAGAYDLLPGWSAYTPTFADDFQDAGAWSRTPAVGSLVFFQWPSMGRIAHVGIVEAVEAAGSIISLEGNTDVGGSRTGGSVCRVRRRANIAGYGRPAWPEEDDVKEAKRTIQINGTGPEIAVIDKGTIALGSAGQKQTLVEGGWVLAGPPLPMSRPEFDALLSALRKV